MYVCMYTFACEKYGSVVVYHMYCTNNNAVQNHYVFKHLIMQQITQILLYSTIIVNGSLIQYTTVWLLCLAELQCMNSCPISNCWHLKLAIFFRAI